MATEKLQVSQFPADLHTEVTDRIAQSTTGLNRITREGKREHSELIGSGTLVILNGKHCILTARHVAEAIIKKGDSLSLMTSFDGKMQRYSYPKTALDFRLSDDATNGDESAGPDVAVIVLPQAAIGYLIAQKTFYNIDMRVGAFVKHPADEGFWFSCGVVKEGMQKLGTVDQFQDVKGYWGLCGVGANPKEWTADGFDYLDFDVHYPREDLPQSFQGLSGGGVWQILFNRSADGTVAPVEFILSGVVFFETAIQNDRRQLRCHGRDTVCQQVPALVARPNPSR